MRAPIGSSLSESVEVVAQPVSDVNTQLAFSVYEGKGVFALLLGSGLSRAAGIPTGWEITPDLIRRVGLAQKIKEQPDWAEWYRQKAGQEPNYSTLLEELASTSEERRSILQGYVLTTARALMAMGNEIVQAEESVRRALMGANGPGAPCGCYQGPPDDLPSASAKGERDQT